MKEQDFLHLIGEVDDRFIAEMCDTYAGETSVLSSFTERRTAKNMNTRIVHMKKKRIVSLALATALILALGVAAYAAWNIHEARQSELRNELNIDTAHVESYVEYALPESAEVTSLSKNEKNVVLLSALRSNTELNVFANVSPVEAETTDTGVQVKEADFFYYIDKGAQSKDVWCVAMPVKYDDATKTLTLRCVFDNSVLSKTFDADGQVKISFLRVDREEDTSEYSIFNDWIYAHRESHRIGTVVVSEIKEAEVRRFDFDENTITFPQSNGTARVNSLELSATAAVWNIRFEGIDESNRDSAEAYSMEDYVTQNAKLYFSDGTELSPGGALTGSYENGTANLTCGWNSAININEIERIEIGDIVLWENK